MPVVANATIEVTPVLGGAQQSLTDQLVGAAEPAAEAAGEKSGSKFGSGLVKSIAAGSAAVGAAVAGTGTALMAAAGKTAEYGDSIDKASQKLGVSSTFYQEWQAVLQHSGTDMDKMSATFKKLAQASRGASQDQEEAFEALGLSMSEVANMSTEDLFANVVSGLQGMEEGTERTTLATTLLGKGAMEMGALFNTSAEDTQGMIDKVHELGGIMDESAVKDAAAYHDAMQDMTTAMDGVKNGVIASLLPAMTDLFNKVGDFIGNTDLSPITDTIGKAVEAVGDFIGAIDIQAVGEIFMNVVSAIGDVVGTAWEVIQEVFGGLKEGFDTISAALSEGGVEWSDVWGGISSTLQTVGTIISTVIQAIAKVIAWLITETQKDGTLFNAVWKGIQTAVKTAQDVIKGVVDFVSALLDGDWSAAWDAAKGVVDSITGGISEILSNTWDSIKETASNMWGNIKDAITQPIQDAKDTISGIVDKIKEFFPLKLGKIFSGIELPHFKISGGTVPWGIGGMGEAPSVSIKWYRRAMEQPYMFGQSTIFAAGEAGDEMLYGHEALMEDIKTAVGGPNMVFNVTVNGADRPEEWAHRLLREAKQYGRLA